jgi:hypothetical protein
MAAGYVIPIDPNELASRFPSYDPRDDEDEEDDFLESEECQVSTEDMQAFLGDGNDFEERVAPLLDRIPEREADLIYLYFICHKRQADIAVMFGITQAAVSYRLDRGIQRIKFLLSIPHVTEEDLRRDLPAIFPMRARESRNIDVDILVGMWETTCQSEVANRLSLTQGRVRHRFFKAVKVLEKEAKEDDTFEPYFKIFSAIAAGKKFNILREVKLPQWADRGGDECT